MPQADLSYSAQIPLDAASFLAAVEETIQAHDPNSGACKGRAHALDMTHHAHILLRVRMLKKPHRDEAFMQDLLAALQSTLRPHVPRACIFGVEIGFLETHYASLTLD
jgi:hypothetical protein